MSPAHGTTDFTFSTKGWYSLMIQLPVPNSKCDSLQQKVLIALATSYWFGINTYNSIISPQQSFQVRRSS